MFTRLKEAFAHLKEKPARVDMIANLYEMNHFQKLEVDSATYNTANGSYTAAFTGVTSGGHPVQGTITKTRDDAFWTSSNHHFNQSRSY